MAILASPIGFDIRKRLHRCVFVFVRLCFRSKVTQTPHRNTKDFPMQSNWLTYALITTGLWGLWGAFTGLPSEHGFPDTLIYVVWALTMIPPAVVVLARAGWRIQRDRRSIVLGLAVGLLGAGGQMLLFRAVQSGPAYLIFPIVSLSPAITIALSFGLLGERTGKLGVAGIALALCALPLFDLQLGQGGEGLGLWFVLALVVMAAWGLQAYFIKLANVGTSAESIFFYMMLGGLPACRALCADGLLPAHPLGLAGPRPRRRHPGAERHRRADAGLRLPLRQGLVVSPLVNAGAPLLTAVLSMALSGAMPTGTKLLACPGPARRAAAGAAARNTLFHATCSRRRRMKPCSTSCAATSKPGTGPAVGIPPSARPTPSSSPPRCTSAPQRPPALIEATSNQVNQDGGYTGMTPLDFRRHVQHMAARGPGAGAAAAGRRPPRPQRLAQAAGRAAMAKARSWWRSTSAGFRKIHLDCSMSCADDPVPLPEPEIAARAVRLCRAAEQAWRDAPSAASRRSTSSAPKCPCRRRARGPGRAGRDLARGRRLHAGLHRDAFARAGLEAAWERVIAMVVQPGVEFDHHKVIDYRPERRAP
jgi:uncharacterized membrane protein